MAGDDRAAAEDMQPVAEVVDLGKIGGDQDDAGAGLEQAGEDFVDLDLGADIDADRRLVEDEELGAMVEPFADDDLLLVAAGECRGGHAGRSGDDAQIGDLLGGVPLARRWVSTRPIGLMRLKTGRLRLKPTPMLRHRP